MRLPMKFALSTSVVVLFFLASSTVLHGKDACVAANGLQICVQMKGPCDIGHLLSRETSGLRMDLFYVSILNKSNQIIKISPEDFYGVTVGGQIIALDAPFYESIELKTKLRRKDLSPQESTSGFLFFPTSHGQIRKLIHGRDPFLEVMLF